MVTQKYREQKSKGQRAMSRQLCGVASNGDQMAIQIRETRQTDQNVEYQGQGLFGGYHALLNSIRPPIKHWEWDIDLLKSILADDPQLLQIPDHPHHDFAQNQILQVFLFFLFFIPFYIIFNISFCFYYTL